MDIAEGIETKLTINPRVRHQQLISSSHSLIEFGTRSLRSLYPRSLPSINSFSHWNIFKISIQMASDNQHSPFAFQLVILSSFVHSLIDIIIHLNLHSRQRKYWFYVKVDFHGFDEMSTILDPLNQKKQVLRWFLSLW